MSKRLSVMDSSWLQMETRETPMHVGGLQLFELPEDAGADFMRTAMESMLNVPGIAPPFNQKLDMPMGGLTGARWIEDTQFDLDYHVRHAALPKPGRIRELLALVSRLHGELLDRSRPLWEMYVIEGLSDNRFAVFTKIHHSMIDGVAGMKLMQSRMSHNANELTPAPFSSEWLDLQPKKAKKEAKEGDFGMPLKARLASQANVLSGLGQTVMEYSDLYQNPQREGAVAPYQAPKTMMNVRITGARRFAAETWSLSRVKAVAKANGGTLNDVVLAMVSGCLRRYLESQNQLPDTPLIANVPVSIRPADGDATGNAITLIQANLGTHLEDPVERLRAIQTSMAASKERLGRMGKTEMQAFTTLANLPFTIGQVVPLGGRVPPMFNVVVSNVPGPKEPLYLHGAKLLATYPASLAFHGYALNITLTSYMDNLDFGFTACRETLPSIQRMLEYTEESLAELEQAGKAANAA